MPPAAHAGGLLITTLMVLMGGAGLLHAIARKDFDWKAHVFWFLPLAALFVWANITVLWSPFDQRGGWTNAHTAITVGLLMVWAPLALHAVKPERQLLLRHLFLATSLMAAGLLLIDVLSGWGLSILIDPIQPDENLGHRQNDALMNVGHGIYIYAMFAAPFTAIALKTLRRDVAWGLIALYVIALALAAYFNLLQIGWLVLCVTLLVMPLAYKWPRPTILGFCGLAVLSILAAPILGITSGKILTSETISLPGSWDHRLRMWAYCWAEIKQNPFLGHGFDVSRTYSETYKTPAGYDMAIVSLHPHNIGIQLWLETGLVGVLLFCAFILGLIKQALKYAGSPLCAAALSGLLASNVLIYATTVNLWHDYVWGSTVFALVILTLIPRGSANDNESSSA